MACGESDISIPARTAAFLPPDGAPVAVAVSGGPDSMALCHALSHAAQGAVHVLTVDHGLRAGAAVEAAEVGRRVAGWPNIRHSVLTRASEKIGASRLMEDARRDRYALLAAYCADKGIAHLFTAHHQDDQAETFLFRLAKGSGLDGLGAMRPLHSYDAHLTIVRPLLDVPKAALVDYCRVHDIPFFEDPSNEDDRFARVRLRQAYDVLAAEGLTAKRLSVTAARLARAREALDFYAEELLARAVCETAPHRIVLRFAGLAAAPAETRLRVLLRAMDGLGGGGEYGPRREQAEGLCERLFAPGFKRETLGGLLIGLEGKTGLLVIEKETGKPS